MKKLSRLSFVFFQLFLIALPFGQLVRFNKAQLPIGANAYLYDLFLFSALVFNLIGIIGQLKKNPKYFRGLALFTALCLLSLVPWLQVRTQTQLMVGLLYLARWIAYTLTFVLVKDYLDQKLITKKGILNCLGWVGLASVGFGLIQYAFWPDLIATQARGWDPHYYRIVGSFIDPGFTSLVFVFTLFLFLNRYLKDKKRLDLVWVIVTYIALALTYARSGYLAFLVGLGVWSRIKKNWRYLAIGFIALALTIFVLPRPMGEGVRLERTSTIWARVDNYLNTLTIIQDKPWLGVGFNLYRYTQQDYGFLEEELSHAGAGADSSLLFVMATTGIVGLFGYLLFWVRSAGSLPKKEAFVWATLIGWLIHSTFLNSQFYPILIAWVWILLGVSLRSESR